MTDWYLLEGASYIFAFRDRKTCAEQQGGDQPILHGLAVDLILNQRSQDTRTLRMANQHYATSLVVVLEIVLPRVDDVVVCKNTIGWNGFACNICPQRSQRHLSVQRRVNPALRSEPRELRTDYAHFFGAGIHIAVAARIVRHGWVDVEAI